MTYREGWNDAVEHFGFNNTEQDLWSEGYDAGWIDANEIYDDNSVREYGDGYSDGYEDGRKDQRKATPLLVRQQIVAFAAGAIIAKLVFYFIF